jgi:hypothetical protein
MSNIEVLHNRGLIGADFVRVHPEVFQPRSRNYHSRSVIGGSGRAALVGAVRNEPPEAVEPVETEAVQTPVDTGRFSLRSVAEGIRRAAFRARQELSTAA